MKITVPLMNGAYNLKVLCCLCHTCIIKENAKILNSVWVRKWFSRTWSITAIGIVGPSLILTVTTSIHGCNYTGIKDLLWKPVAFFTSKKWCWLWETPNGAYSRPQDIFSYSILCLETVDLSDGFTVLSVHLYNNHWGPLLNPVCMGCLCRRK